MKKVLSTLLLACCAVPMMAEGKMQPMIVVMPNGSIPMCASSSSPRATLRILPIRTAWPR